MPQSSPKAVASWPLSNVKLYEYEDGSLMIFGKSGRADLIINIEKRNTKYRQFLATKPHDEGSR